MPCLTATPVSARHPPVTLAQIGLSMREECSIFVRMPDWLTPSPRPNTWPRPPAALPAGRLNEPPAGARVCVAGLVLVRQRPGTAKGVIFVTLEDETGTANVVVWAQVYERFRRAVISGRLLRVTGRLQREAGVVHVVAENIEDLSHLLDRLLHPDFRAEFARAGDQP